MAARKRGDGWIRQAEFKRLLRIVAGAVQNAANAHPDYVIRRRVNAMKNSIAKRVVGALRNELRSERGTRLTHTDSSRVRGGAGD